ACAHVARRSTNRLAAARWSGRCTSGGLQGATRGRAFRLTTVSAEATTRPADLVPRSFTAERPNALWVADFTYAVTWRGFAYVAFVIDVFARYIVGWRVATTMEASLVLDALEQALAARFHRALRRQRRRFVRQRARRVRDRPRQDRGHPAPGPVAARGGRRVRDPHLGRLVQHPPAARAARQGAANRVRSGLLPASGEPRHGGGTHVTEPPGEPAGHGARPAGLGLHAASFPRDGQSDGLVDW